MQQNRFPFPDRESSMKIFMNDPCYGKIPADRTQSAFDDAWAAGINEARSFIEKYCYPFKFEMLSILKQLGFRIVQEDTDYVMGSIRYFCEYLPGKKQISIYSKAVRLWAEAHCMEFETARNIILAHEYFHYLETHKLGLISKRCVVPMLKLGKLSIGKTGVSALSEVAANAFANEYYAAYMMSLNQPDEEELTVFE